MKQTLTAAQIRALIEAQPEPGKMRRCCGFVGTEYHQEPHQCSEDDFARQPSRRTGFASRCQNCRRAYGREYSKRYQPENAAKVAAKMRNWRAKQKDARLDERIGETL